MDKKGIYAMFPDDYWEHFYKEFGHDFVDAHYARTAVYESKFFSDLQGKRVIEAGGYPGLLIAAYILSGIDVVCAFDHPDYRPAYYLSWMKEMGIPSIEHNFNSGYPEGPIPEADVMVMSDVLLHNGGFPTKFIEWALSHVKEIYLINYEGSGPVLESREFDLKKGFRVPNSTAIIAHMHTLGASCSRRDSSADRSLLVFKPGEPCVP